jgi:hypothetical protein
VITLRTPSRFLNWKILHASIGQNNLGRQPDAKGIMTGHSKMWK